MVSVCVFFWFLSKSDVNSRLSSSWQTGGVPKLCPCLTLNGKRAMGHLRRTGCHDAEQDFFFAHACFGVSVLSAADLSGKGCVNAVGLQL